MSEINGAVRSRPQIEGYGIPTGEEGLLPWSFVSERLAKARNYWLATVEPNGRPHAVPVWGIWVNQTLHFGGGPDTRWSRNLAVSPEVVIHLDSSDEVVILKGTVTKITAPEQIDPLDDLYEQKYSMRHGPPMWVLKLRAAFAWQEYPQTTTRWLFP